MLYLVKLLHTLKPIYCYDGTINVHSDEEKKRKRTRQLVKSDLDDDAAASYHHQ